MNECEWCNGNESIIEYVGNGSEPLNIGIKHLKLSDKCVLVDWDVLLCIIWNQSKLAMNVLDQCNHSKSMD